MNKRALLLVITFLLLSNQVDLLGAASSRSSNNLLRTLKRPFEKLNAPYGKTEDGRQLELLVSTSPQEPQAPSSSLSQQSVESKRDSDSPGLMPQSKPGFLQRLRNMLWSSASNKDNTKELSKTLQRYIEKQPTILENHELNVQSKTIEGMHNELVASFLAEIIQSIVNKYNTWLRKYNSVYIKNLDQFVNDLSAICKESINQKYFNSTIKILLEKEVQKPLLRNYVAFGLDQDLLKSDQAQRFLPLSLKDVWESRVKREKEIIKQDPLLHIERIKDYGNNAMREIIVKKTVQDKK